MSDRLVRFPGRSWQEIEALPQPAAMDSSARDLPLNDPLPGAYELHLTADNVTIWYTVTVHEGQEIISVQHVWLDT